MSGGSGAEGKEKGKGVVARRGLKEVQSESAGRRTGTGYEVWYTRGQWARDHEALHRRLGCTLYIRRLRVEGDMFPDRARDKLTPGGLRSVHTD